MATLWERERGGGEITDNLASSEWDEKNEEYLLFGVQKFLDVFTNSCNVLLIGGMMTVGEILYQKRQ